jgi:hypothetical protein
VGNNAAGKYTAAGTPSLDAALSDSGERRRSGPATSRDRPSHDRNTATSPPISPDQPRAGRAAVPHPAPAVHGPGQLPREIRAALTYPLAAALAEGAFTGVVATKYFHASPVLLAVITAAPMFGNIMALVWAELAKTRRMVPFVNRLQLGVVTCVAAVGLTAPLPRRSAGGRSPG